MVRCDNINNLVDCYIKEDKREELWNLAFDYGNEIDLTKIANYYISVRDSFHICELLSIVSNYLDLDYLFDSIVLTNDKEFMFWILNNGTIKSIIDSKYFSKLENACDNR